MPVIPGLEESQRLSPSSPVPMIDAREERLAGAAMETLGEGMMKLSMAMERVDKEKQKVNVANAVADWRTAAGRLETETKSAVPGDKTGIATAEEYRKKLVKVREDLTKNLPGEYHDTFLAEVNEEYSKRWEPMVVSKIAKGIVREGQSAIVQNIEKTTDFVRARPEAVGESIEKITATIMGSDLFTDAEKQEMLPEAINKMVTAGVDKYVDDADFSGAQKYLLSHKERLTDGKSAARLKDYIKDEQMKAINFGNMELKQLKDRYDFEKTRVTTDVHRQAYAMYKAAGSDLVKIKAADNFLDDAVVRYGYPELREMAKSLKTGSTQFTEDTDNQFKVKILSHAFKTGDYKKAISVTQRFTDMPGGITAKSAYGLISQLEIFERGGGNNKRLSILAAEKLLESPINHPDIRMTLDKKLTGPRLVNTVAATKATLYDWVQANPNASPTETYRKARKIFNGIYGTSYTDPLAYKEYDKLEDAQKAYEERGRAHMKEKDKARKGDMFIELQDLRKQIIQLQIQKEVPTGEDKPNQVEKGDNNGRY